MARHVWVEFVCWDVAATETVHKNRPVLTTNAKVSSVLAYTLSTLLHNFQDKKKKKKK
jgi:hypothetical protein